MDKKKMDWKIPSIKNYLEDTKWQWCIVLAFLIGVYGIKFGNIVISHDTEAMLANREGVYDSWYVLGRYGLIFIKKILGTYILNPYIAMALAMIMMLIAGMVWNYFFYWLGGSKKETLKNSWMFPVIFFTSMIMAEQFAFLLQSYEIAVCIVLIGLVLIWLFYTLLNQKPWYYHVPVILLCNIIFGCYQVFVPLFTTGAAIGFILVYERIIEEDKEQMKVSFCLSFIVKLIAVFLISLASYFVTNKIVLKVLGFDTSAYITDQVMWGKYPVGVVIHSILVQAKRIVIGEGIFYSKWMVVPFIFAAIYGIVKVIRKREACCILYLLALFYTMGSTMLLTIYLGTNYAPRTEIILPFVSGFFCCYLAGKLTQRKEKAFQAIYVAFVLMVLYVGNAQMMDSARLYYTQYVQYQQDMATALKISDRIEKLGVGEAPEEPVVFIGWKRTEKAPGSFTSNEIDLTGRSYYEINFAPDHGSLIMLHYFQTLGYCYKCATFEQIYKAHELVQERKIPSWPNEGSVQLIDGMIIVNMGNMGTDE